jgi:formamidopyrimidine-DNA glycosylase
MPELPEVETIRRDLDTKIINKKIKLVQVHKTNMIKGVKSKFINNLQNNQIIKADRIGKLIIFDLASGEHLLMHLKMTGQLIYILKNKITAGGHDWPQVDSLPNKYSHIIFHFVDGSQLFFNDLRQFGYMQLVNSQDRDKIKAKFGIEPLQANFTWSNFKKILANKKSILKPLLLNQQMISGIGNIYADEICFRAEILPDRKIDSLSEVEKKKLFQAIKYIIKAAIERRGTTFSDYVDSTGKSGNFSDQLKVYGRGGEKCLGCRQSNIKKVKLGGRGTTFCPHCQK